MRHSNPEQAVIGKRRRKLELYATASIAGLSVLLLTAPPVQAQAINATGTARTNTGIGGASATITDSGTSTLIQVNAGQAIIDWQPNATNSDQFILAGRTANFYRTDSGGFTVLNVIASGATPMHFDGRVESHLTGSAGPTGGNVWFYSPGGIIVGSGASFDVGSLLLTTINPDPNNLPNQSFTSFNDGQNATINFRADASIYGSGNDYLSQITIASGASLSAQNYIGIVSPRIVQNGTINALGAVGLIAAEGADLNISFDGGLFAISVPMGMGTGYAGDATDPANAAIVNTGTITGAIRPGDITARTISMVAVPKNTAVSVLLGGTIGYADSATADGDSVLVLAGSNVSSAFDGSGVTTWVAPTVDSLPATIQIGESGATSDTIFPVSVNVIGTDVSAIAATHDIVFGHMASLLGTEQSMLTVGTGRTVTAGADLGIISSDTNFNNQFGRVATVTVNGTLRIDPGATLTIEAAGRGLDVFDGSTNSGIGGSVTGGIATLAVEGGTIEGLTAGTPGGSVLVNANAVGGHGFIDGGNGTGGSASVTMNGGSVHLAGLQISAYGLGNDGSPPGIGSGGQANLIATGGSLTVDGDLSIDTFGRERSGNQDGTGLGVNISATTGNSISVGGTFSSISYGQTSIIGPSALTPTIVAGDISIDYDSFLSDNAFLLAISSANTIGNISISGVTSMPAIHLQAVNGITLNSASDIAIGFVTVVAPAEDDGEGNLYTGSAYFRANAGDYFGPLNGGSSNGSISVNGQLTVSGLVQLTAHGSIDVASTGSITTDNILSIGAGGDVRIAAGAVLNAGLNPVNAMDTGIAITVGDDYNMTDLVHSVINAGTINSNNMALSIYGDALQMQNGSIAGNVVVVGLNANGTIGDTDGGQLLTNCSVGSICLGNVNATSVFQIDQSNRLPETVWLAGDMTVPSLNVLANNGIMLGGTGRHDITVGGSATLSTISGGIVGADGSSGTISANIIHLAGSSIATPGHTFRTTSDLTIEIASNVQAAGFDIAGRLGHTQSGFQNGLTLTGDFLVGNTLSVGGGDVRISAQNIGIGGLVTPDTATLNASNDLQVADLSAPGGVMASGNIVSLRSSGTMRVSSLSAGEGGAELIAAGDVVIGTLSAASVEIQSTGGGISADALVSQGPTNLSAVGLISLPNFLSAGPISAVGGGVRIAASPGMPATQSLNFNLLGSTGGDVNVSSMENISIAGGNTIGATTITAGAQLSISSYASSGDLSLFSTTRFDFTNIAGGNVNLVTNNTLTGQRLTATGTTTLNAGPGTVSISGLDSAGGITVDAGRITISAPNAMSVTRATTTSVQLTAGGDLSILSASSTEDSIFSSTNGGIFAQTLTSGAPISFSAAGAVTVASLTAPRVSVDAGSVQIASPGSLVFANAIGRTGGVNLSAQGALTFGIGRAAGNSSFTAGGPLTVTSFATTGNLALQGTTIGAFTALSGQNVSLAATTGALSGQQLVASGTVTLTTPDAITISAISAPGGVTATGSQITLTSPDVLNVTRATAGDGGLRLRAAGALTVANATSTAGIDLASSGGNVTVGTLTMTGTPTGIVGQAAAGTSPLTIASAGTTTLNGDITGAGAATISGAGLVLNGLIDASGISLASQTIAVGPAALIGTLARTGTVAFTNTGTGRSFIGGSGSANGYSLDANALSRIQASSVTLSLLKTATSSTATPDVVIGAFTLYGTGAAAPAGSRQNLATGSLTITTTGQVQVNGAVRLANLASNGSGGLTIRAAGIDVVTPTGSIVQTDASGAPGGTLDLDARIVRVASAAALTNLASLTTPTAREARLAQNDGNMSDTGWLSANTIRFAYPSGVAAGSGIAAIYVQNSGGNGADARRGLTTGTGGVVIADFPTSDPPEVLINGRARAADATFTTGSAFLTSISQTGTGASASDVLVNGCVLSTASCSATTLPTTLISQLAPPQDLISVLSNSTDDDQDEDSTKPGDPVPRKDPQAIIQLAPPNPEQATQSTDDPVIGAGNDSLWNGGNATGGEAGATSFDTTIGVGNDAGPNNDRPGAGANSGGPQQQGERTPGANPSAEGGLGVGNDAPGQRSGGSAPGAPNAPPVPGNIQNGDGIGVGGDAGSGSGAGTTNQGAAGSTGAATPGTTTPNNRQTTPNTPR